MADVKFNRDFGKNAGKSGSVAALAEKRKKDSEKKLKDFTDAQSSACFRLAYMSSDTEGLVMIITELLITIFTLFFTWTRLFMSGFYVYEGRVLALVLSIAALVITIASAVIFFGIMRLHRRTGEYVIRWTLCAAAYTLSGFSLYLLGAWGYLMLICALALAALTFEGVNLYLRGFFGSAPEKEAIYIAAPVVVLVLIFAFIPAFGGFSMEGDSAYVKTGAFERSARYELTEEGAVLDTVMLRASDLFWTSDGEYEILDEVKIDGEIYETYAIGSGALRGAKSIGTVILADGVSLIEDGAFSESGIVRLECSSESLHLEDGLSDSCVEELYISTADTVRISLGEGATLKEGLRITVAPEHYDAFCANNPEFAPYAVPV